MEARNWRVHASENKMKLRRNSHLILEKNLIGSDENVELESSIIMCPLILLDLVDRQTDRHDG